MRENWNNLLSGGIVMKKLGNKIFVLVTGVLVTSVILTILVMQISFRLVLNNLQKELKTSIENAQSSIDVDKLSNVISDQSMDSDDYKDLLESMILYKNEQDVKYLLDETMKKAFAGEIAIDSDPVLDEGQYYMTGYAPIKNSSGEVVAIACMDKSMTLFVNMKQYLIFGILVADLAIILVAVFITFFISKKIGNHAKTIKV